MWNGFGCQEVGLFQLSRPARLNVTVRGVLHLPEEGPDAHRNENEGHGRLSLIMAKQRTNSEGHCSPERKAHKVDPGIKAKNQTRLKRVEGQIRGLRKMVDEDRYCADILIQLSAVHEALRAVGKELLRNHLKHCATDAIRQGGKEAQIMYDELIDLLYKNAR